MIAEIGLIIALGSLILGLINQLQQKKNNEANQKLPLKKMAFRKYYKLAEDIMLRMKFTDPIRKERFTIYNYEIKKKDSDENLDRTDKITLIQRLTNEGTRVFDVTGIPMRETDDIVEAHRKKLEGWMITPDAISIPNDLLPKYREFIVHEFLIDIIESAGDYGVKPKDLDIKKNLKKKFKIYLKQLKKDNL